MNNRLKEVRAYYNLSMREFAAKLGMTSGAICLLENGDRQISKKFQVSLLSVFSEINETWFLTGEGDMLKPKTRESEIAAIVDQMLDSSDDDIRLRITKVLYSLSESQLETLAQIGRDIFANEKQP